MRVLMSVCVAAMLVMGCERSAETAGGRPDASVLPAGLFEAPAAAPVSVLAAKKSAAPGDEVTIRGVIGGRAKPFVENRAIFTLVDETIEMCTSPGDSCPVPWDACCEPADEVAAASISVQVVDESGRPLPTGLQGQSGLAPLSNVTVHGIFRTSADGKAATIDARRIAVAIP